MSADACVAVNAGVIRGVIGAVDCRTRDFAEMGYVALTGSGSPFPAALTALLTIYVAVLGFRLLFAAEGARLSDAPMAALKIGAILALVTSWSTFQTLVFDVAAKAPVEIAAVASGPIRAEGSALVADPVGGLQVAYDQMAATAGAFGRLAGPVARAYNSAEAAAGEALSAADGALFMTTAGLIAVATIAVGILTAIGPLFVALLLFRQTRGLFVGWVRALSIAALTPIGAWILIVMELSVIEPWLVALAQQRRDNLLDVQTAMTASALVFVFAAGQAALLVCAAVIGAGFRLDLGRREPRAPLAPQAGEPAAVSIDASRAQRLAQSVVRMDSTRRLGGAAGVIAAGAVSAEGRAAVPGAPIRLGEAWRRPAFRDRRTAGEGAGR